MRKLNRGNWLEKAHLFSILQKKEYKNIPKGVRNYILGKHLGWYEYISQSGATNHFHVLKYDNNKSKASLCEMIPSTNNSYKSPDEPPVEWRCKLCLKAVGYGKVLLEELEKEFK